MKNAHPIITATSSGLVSPDSSFSNEPTEPIIRLKLDKPLHWEWELTTSADALPVIQLLDKDGRLLVETTGRTAQRARGSFREGLRSHEEFPVSRSASDKPSTISSFSSTSTPSSTILIPAQGNRNIEGFSTKFGTCQFGYKPRKSRSDASVVKEREKKGRKRYCNESETTTKQQPEETKTSSKSYSAGDYLRQQIVEDLRRKHTLGRSPEEIAKERCRKMKAYLRSQSEILPKLVHLEEEESSEGSKPKTDKEKDDVRSRRLIDGLNRLREAIRKEDTLSKKSSSAAEVRHDVSKNDSIRNELSVHPSEDCESTGIESKTKNEELEAVKAFLQRKIQQKMEQERSGSSSRCDSQSQVAIKKRYSDYRQPEDLRGYHTRKVRSETNIIRFHPEILQKEKQKSIRQLEKERSSRSNGRPTEDSFDRTVCRRSKSEATLGAAETIRRNHRQRSQTREPTEKRKLYRKTKSDVLIGQMFSSLDSEQENPPRRIKSQDNVDESWREYKERKKHEKLYRESDEMEAKEEDFMGRPRWKDVQARLCSFRNCKICQNLRNCVDPLRQPRVSPENSGISGDAPTNDTSDVISASTSDRPSTSLQENYLVVDGKSDGPMNHVLAMAHLRNRGADLSNVNSPDCGYNTIPKNAFNDYKDLYARSSVKKSDTFKIVDGSEDHEDGAEENDSKTGLDERTVDGYECSGSGGVLTNKSNEDIARDYFKRVYELLKKRQEEAKRMAEMQEVGGCDDSSSSNYVEKVQKKRPRRKKKDRSVQGEEVVTVPPVSGGQDSWKVQRLSLNGESPNNRRKGCRPQVQPGTKRTRPAPPIPAVSCKVNAKDIDEYLDWPNKENTPGNAVNTGEGTTGAAQNENEGSTMGSNLSRHNGKGLTGRRTQSSGNLCDPKGKLNSMGKILVPCSSAQKERYKFCGSLPNHLDDKDVLDDDAKENNNIMTDTMGGNLGGTLPHKKRTLGVHFSDGEPTGTLDLVKHRSQDSLDENDPWRYQQSDLDLVRCRHGNFDSVRRNRSVDTVSGDSTRRYARGTSVEDRCHRKSDLDLVGTLPKRKQDSRNGGKASETNSSASQPGIPGATDNGLLMQIVHKPDCELVRHRQQFSKCLDLQLSKLTGGEPQDQGYASERSPEDEHPPSLPGQPFPNITPECTFRVTLQKSSRGLGLSVSGGGTAGPVRVKRLFPQQPAALSNKLQPGDILLAANGVPLTGLTNYEALEVLRTTPSTVELVVCRLPGDTTVTPPGAPPPPPARREPPPPLRILNPLPPLQIEPCGEFDIEMTKVGGSLGFTLRKADSSALGHYVRALVREPALSDGRIQPGDKIVAVDGAPLSPMSHEEAVQLLRQCGPTVRLRLYRDLAQTPVSALSPTEPDHPLRPPRTSLRQEAVDMLCDLAVRKLSPGTSSGSSCKQSPGASCNSPRRHRRLATRTPTIDNDQETLEKHPSMHTTSAASQAETSDSDQCSIRTQITNSQPNTPGTDIIDPPPLYDVCDSSDSSRTPTRPSFLDLSAPQEKPHYQFCSLDSDQDYPGGEEANAVEDEPGDKATVADYKRRDANLLSSDEQDNDLPSEPASMPPVLSSTSSSSAAAFSYKNPAYQSANPACGVGIDVAAKNKATHSSDQDIPGKILGAEDPGGSKGLLKWKGVMFAPDDGIDKTEKEGKAGKDTTDSAVANKDFEQGTEVFMVELTRGWNSRLGFSLQPEGNRTVISVVHPDSVAAKDGRLKQGDVLVMVNDESVEHMSTADIIDLLRKIRGSIGITVMRRSKRENVT